MMDLTRAAPPLVGWWNRVGRLHGLDRGLGRRHYRRYGHGRRHRVRGGCGGCGHDTHHDL